METDIYRQDRTPAPFIEADPVIQSELPSLSDRPPPPFWPEKGKILATDRRRSRVGTGGRGGGGGGGSGGDREGGGKRGGEGRMRAEGYSAPSGG